VLKVKQKPTFRMKRSALCSPRILRCGKR
jgi:hypothetical protein